MIFCKDTCSAKKDYIFDYLDGKIDISQQDFSFIQQMLEVSHCTADCILKRTNDKNKSVIDRFDKLLIKKTESDKTTNYQFMNGRTASWASDKTDLDLIKKLYMYYPDILVRLNPLPFDKTPVLRKALIDYYNWRLQYIKENRTTIGSFCNNIYYCFYDHMIKKVISADFIQMLIGFMEQNDISSWLHTSNYDVLKEYVKDNQT